MKDQDNHLGEGERLPVSSELLLKKFAAICASFRERDPEAEPDDEDEYSARPSLTAFGLNIRIQDLLDRFPLLAFPKGIDALAVRGLPDAPQALFYCFAELFLSRPIAPVDVSCFGSAPASRAFREGIDCLLRKDLVITVSVNNADEARARKDMYILSPMACNRLFRGREDLVCASVAVQFGTVLPWNAIREKELMFPDALRESLQLMSRAVSRDRYEAVREGLRRNGFRSGLTFLLSGPPGTGKTEFVRQLARSERRNIFQVDASKLDGAYFGEKPRNLRDLFLFSRYMSAIMPDEPMVFIDEADSLLGRRVEATRSGDKEENLSVNTILEELNTFSGILFAATNNLSGLDPAMLRRFLLRAVFPVPDVGVRARIWRARLPFLTEDEALDVAGRFSLSGGLIDNVASLCLLERIVYDREPSFEQVVRNCEGQSGKAAERKKIGF